MLRIVQTVAVNHRGSTGSDDDDLPPVTKFMSSPKASGKVASRLSRVTDTVESEDSAKEAGTPSSGFYNLTVCFDM